MLENGAERGGEGKLAGVKEDLKGGILTQVLILTLGLKY